MGRGARDDKVLLPETVLDDLDELRTWIRRAIAFTAALPPKAAANRKPKPKAKPAAKARRATAAPRRER
jgi:hypothetical protein